MPVKRFVGAFAAATLLGTGLAIGLAAPATAYIPEPPRRPSQPQPTIHHAYVAILEGAGPYDGQTNEELGDLVRRARNYWTSEAGAAIPEFPVTVGTFVRTHPTDACAPNYGGGGALAPAEALYPDVDFADEANHLVVIVPDECLDDGGLVGWASAGLDIASGGRIVVDAEWGDPFRQLVQLFARNFGLGDTDIPRECSPSDPDFCGGPAPVDDLYSPMAWPPSSDPVALGTANRATLGLVDEAESPVVELAQNQSSVTAHYRIKPRSAETGRRSVTVIDPGNGRRYYLDYRSGTGRDAGAAYVGAPSQEYVSWGTGVTITSVSWRTELWPVETGWGDEYYGYHSYRAVWLPGETFSTADGVVRVTVDDIEPGEWADVTVELATDAVPFDVPTAPLLTFHRNNGPVEDQPDCQDQAEVGWDNDWPPDTYFEIYWYAGGRRAFLQLDTKVGTFARLDAPCYRGKRLQVEITARAPGHRAVTAYSNRIGPLTRHYLGNASIWTVEGSLVVRAEAGRPLEAYAVFYPNASVGGGPFPAESLQWYVDGDPVPGATGKRYTPDDDDVGKSVTLRAVRDDPEYDRTVFVSQAVEIEPSGFVRARPTLAGTPRVGEVLRAHTDGWSPGTSFTYSWQRDGLVVSGARDATYRLTADDLGADVRVVVEGTLAGYAPAERSSDAVRVGRGVLTTERPVVRGAARVGKRLVAVPGAWTAGTVFSYQWLVGRHVIRGATASSYVVKARQHGRRLRVRVTGARGGYTSETLTSLAVRVGGAS